MPDTKRLLERHGWYYYNRRLPKHLVGLIQRDLINKDGLIRYNLNTSDEKHAIRYRNCEDVKWDAIFQAAEHGKPLPLTRNQAIKLVQQYVEKMDNEWRQRHIKEGPEDEQQRLEIKIDAGEPVR